MTMLRSSLRDTACRGMALPRMSYETHMESNNSTDLSEAEPSGVIRRLRARTFRPGHGSVADDSDDRRRALLTDGFAAGQTRS